MNPLNKIRIHISEIIKMRFNPSYISFKFLLILNRRKKLSWIPKARYFVEQYGNYDEYLLCKYIKTSKNKTAIDIGANIGAWSIKYSDKFEKIYAFEPNPLTYAHLKKNIKKYKKIKAFQCALGNENNINDLYIHNRPGRDSLSHKSEDYIKSIKVKCRKLDDFGFNNIGLIKIDTEGFEWHILLGSHKTIKRENPQLYIEIHQENQIEPIKSFLKELNYEYNEFLLSSREFPFIITK